MQKENFLPDHARSLRRSMKIEGGIVLAGIFSIGSEVTDVEPLLRLGITFGAGFLALEGLHRYQEHVLRNTQDQNESGQQG